jgi:hypothetical protein
VRTDPAEAGELSEAKLMALSPGSGRLVGNKAINLDFWAPFFGSFFGRAKNEQINHGQAEKQEPQNYLQP